MTDKNKQVFKCPKCDKLFSYNELFSHNEELFKNIIEESVETEIKNVKSKLSADFEHKWKHREMELNEKNVKHLKVHVEKQKEFEHQVRTYKQELDKQQNYFQTRISELENLKKVEIQNAENAITNRLIKEYTEIEMKKEMKVHELENELRKMENLVKKMENEKEEQVRKLNILFHEKHHASLKKYEDRIKELEITNAQNRIINSKVKGENFENEAEGELRKVFGFTDSINKITSGDKKADYLMTVKSHDGSEIGRIVFELKNAKWSDAWEKKLAEDMVKEGGKYGILVASSFNDKYKEVPFVRSTGFKNIWISDHLSFIFVGQILRKLIEVEYEFERKTAVLTKDEQNEALVIYESKMQALKNLMLEKLPIIVSKLRKQYLDLEMVSNSLSSNAKIVKKSLEIIKSQVENKIIKELEEITSLQFNTKVNRNEEDENDE